MKGFKRQYHNPMDFIKKYLSEFDATHITYNPDMKISEGQYCMLRQGGGDGTLLFTIETILSALEPVLKMQTYFTGLDPVNWDEIKSIEYEIGPIRHVTVFGKIMLKCGGPYPGQRDRVRMPIKCKLIKK